MSVLPVAATRRKSSWSAPVNAAVQLLCRGQEGTVCSSPEASAGHVNRRLWGHSGAWAGLLRYRTLFQRLVLFGEFFVS